MLQAQVNYWTLQETRRHNMTAEELEAQNLKIQDFNAKENQRHNQMSELFNIANLNETRRHNVKSENLGFDTLAETQRHNLQTERLTGRSISVDYMNAQTNAKNAYTNRMNAQTNRYAAVQQAGIGWKNAASQAEQAHAASYNAFTNRNAAMETVRHNQQTEKLGIAGQLNQTFSTIVGAGTSVYNADQNYAGRIDAANTKYWNSQW